MKYLLYLLLAVTLLHQIPECQSLKITSLEIPSEVWIGESAKLTCNYDIENDKLYSVQWYKDNIEFFRYIPHETPSGIYYRMSGVNVDIDLSNNKTVYLKNLTLKSSGRYMCEVSADSPTFLTAHKEGQLVVNTGLKITSLDIPSSVKVGQSAKLTCNYKLGKDTLYSARWFKDSIEIYKYSPTQTPAGIYFSHPGIMIDVNESNDKSIYLQNVTLETAGTYRCEVSADYTFKTVTSEGQLAVTTETALSIVTNESDSKTSTTVAPQEKAYKIEREIYCAHALLLVLCMLLV